MVRRVLALVVCASAGVVLLGSCGGDETKFTAQEFVDAANEEGAGLTLGEQLEAVDQPHEVFAATLAEEEEEGHAAEGEEKHAGGEEAGHEHGGAASLVIAADEEAAIGEFERCETAITLTCFRVANVVVRVESGEPALLAHLQEAIQALDPG